MRLFILNVLCMFAVISALPAELDVNVFGEEVSLVQDISKLCARLDVYSESDHDWQEVFDTLNGNACEPLRVEIGDQNTGDVDEQFEPEEAFVHICNRMDNMNLDRPEGLSDNVYDVLLDIGELCESARELLDYEGVEDDDDEEEDDDDEEDDEDDDEDDDDDDEYGILNYNGDEDEEEDEDNLSVKMIVD